MRLTGGSQLIVSESLDAGSTWTITRGTPDGTNMFGAHFYAQDDGYYTSGASVFITSDGAQTGTISYTEPSGFRMAAVWTQEAIEFPCGCPEGYTYNPATDECEITITVEATCSETIYPVIKASTNAQYGQMGTNFYDSTVGLPLPLTSIGGTPWVNGVYPELVGGAIYDDNSNQVPYTNINALTNNFWGNCNPANPYSGLFVPPCTGSDESGRLNAVGVWASLAGTPENEWIGFTTCVNVEETGTYFIGIGSDESSRFKIDGVLFAELFPGGFDEYSTWRVFPVQLTAGQHIIEMEGLNTTGPGAFGAEIYKVPNDDVNTKYLMMM
jgi:hypothetical protein